MMIQYGYAVLTMLPCPLWFHNQFASSAFLIIVFAWSIYNGATYYIDVFGKRFQRELEAMKAEVLKWQNSPELMLQSPSLAPYTEAAINSAAISQNQSAEPVANLVSEKAETQEKIQKNSTSRPRLETPRSTSLDRIPLLDEGVGAAATGVDAGAKDIARERKPQSMH